MLAQTLTRVPEEKFSQPVIVCNAAHAEMVTGHCAGRATTLILEPAARNTAPAIALAALALPEEALMLVSPSDHVIADVAAFHEAIAAAIPLAEQDWLVTFGITPTGPETGYGYIRRGAEISGKLCEVERFVEKPDLITAQAYLDEGCYNWNAGIFLLRAGAYIDALREHAPQMLDAARQAMEQAVREGSHVLPDGTAFKASPSDSVDYAVMEKAAKVAVVPVDMGWSDIGSWDALYELLEKDGDANLHVGDVISLDSSGCLVRSEGPLVTLSGVKDLVVVATNDAVMILPRGQSQDVKKIVDALKAGQHPILSH